MRIALLIESLEAGGAQRQMIGLARMLVQSGCQVKLFCYYERDFYKSELLACGAEYECIHDDRRHLNRVPLLARALKRFNPDRVISFLDTPGMMSCAIKMLTHAHWKLIVGERNTTQNLTRKEKLKFLLYRAADKIVPNSRSQARFICDRFPNLANKLTVITNFVDTDYFSPGIRDEKPGSTPLRIICVGRIVPQKNITGLLKAVAAIKDSGRKFKIDWFGEKHDETYLKECQKIIEEEELENCFEFLPPSSKIRDEYRKSDIFCLPSLYEGFPNVLCEAMSCGLPVVCSNVCDNPDIAQEVESGFLFNPLSTEEIAAALTKMIDSDLTMRKRMSEYNRRFAIENFSDRSFLNKYLSVMR